VWVSRKRWDDLLSRVRQIESDGRILRMELDSYTQFSYSDTYRTRSVPIHDVLGRLLKHLGLELDYIPGRRESADLVKAKRG